MRASRSPQAFGASESACVSDSAMYDMPAQVEAKIVAGTIHFNAADAATCLAGITFPACAMYWANGPNAPAACATALVGTIADGGACVVDYECSNGMSYCDETTKKCTVDTMARTSSPDAEPTLRTMQALTSSVVENRYDN